MEHAFLRESSNRKRGLPFQNSTYSQERTENVCPINIATRISGVSWLMESAQDNDFLFLFLNFDPVLWQNSPKFVELNEME